MCACIDSAPLILAHIQIEFKHTNCHWKFELLASANNGYPTEAASNLVFSVILIKNTHFDVNTGYIKRPTRKSKLVKASKRKRL